MDKRIVFTLVAAWMALCVSDQARADIVAAGNWQIANGGTTDWQPSSGVSFVPLGGGLFELNLTGLAGAGAGTRFEFKALEAPGGPATAAWGQQEVPAVTTGIADKNTWFATDANGDVTITLDRNTYDDGFFPATDRVWTSTDATVFSNYYATGNWQTEAGAGANDDPANALFAMTDQGAGLYSVDVTIATPGDYEYTATAQLSGGSSFDFEFGSDGRYRHDDGDTLTRPLNFTTVASDQEVTFLLDLSKGAIGFTTSTFLPGDTDGDTVIEFEDDFFPIRDNWLVETFRRELGNIDNGGSSEGIVDAADFRQWKDACEAAGCATPAQIAAAFNVLGVPEPSTALLTVAGAMGLVARRRRRC